MTVVTRYRTLAGDTPPNSCVLQNPTKKLQTNKRRSRHVVQLNVVLYMKAYKPCYAFRVY